MSEYPEFAAIERKGWSDAEVAASYADRFARASVQALPSLLAAVSPQPGEDALDLCCGPGQAARKLAGAGAKVTGLDFSPVMLEMARAASPGIRFVEGDAQALPFDDASFDVVACNLGIVHVPDPAKALAEARRVLRPGGRFATTGWAGPDASPGFAILMKAIAAHGDPAAAAPPAPDNFFLADKAKATAALEAAGFGHVSHAMLDVVMPIESAEAFHEICRRGTVRVGTVLAGQPPEAAEAIARAVAAGVRDWMAASGREGFPVDLPMPCGLAAGRV